MRTPAHQLERHGPQFLHRLQQLLAQWPLVDIPHVTLDLRDLARPENETVALAEFGVVHQPPERYFGESHVVRLAHRVQFSHRGVELRFVVDDAVLVAEVVAFFVPRAFEVGVERYVPG